MKKILLTQNRFTLVDDEDYRWLNQFKWYYHSSGYARRNIYKNRKRVSLYMQKLIINCPKNMQIDHISGDGLDNRKSNLRIVTQNQNLFNKKLYKNNKSGFKGIWWYKKIKRWQVYITLHKKPIYLGVFINKFKAILAYNQAAIKYHKEFGRLNKL